MIHRGGWERKSYELKDLCAHIYMTGEATSRDVVNAKSSEEDPRTIGGLVSGLPHPRVNKIKQHTHRSNHQYHTGFHSSSP